MTEREAFDRIEYWKQKAIEAANRACEECEEYLSRKPEQCEKCRIMKIRREAKE